ncbi:MAG: drug/metabolite exporter YedA [Acidimicrobiia bacterium]|nr:drug/metabolite exporter YedA [Acidimicrobiia bacterium]MDH3398882.1 drug/metabolite exporter YedA [Acidimicrobiia bacterium]
MPPSAIITNSPPSTANRRLLIVLAQLAVYTIWGSTYLALRYMVEGFPPFLGNAIRMLIAGAILYTWMRFRGAPAPTVRQWRNGFLIGSLLFVGGLGLVTTAEGMGVGSGLAATAVGMTPVWAAVVSGFFDRWPTRMEWVGLVIGIVGVVILSREGDFDALPLGLFLLILAPLLWAIASVWSNHVELPAGFMSTAVQMLCGGLALSLAGVIAGESIGAVPGARSWWALVYLIGPGSLIAFSAYAYLLRTVRPVLATSYAYVNPVVAVGLGVTLGKETLTGETWIALPLILGAVALIARSRT